MQTKIGVVVFGTLAVLMAWAVFSSGTAPAEETVTSAAVERGPLPQGVVAERPAEGFYVETERGFMVPYTTTIPGTDIEYRMVPIPGGVFTFGSPESEVGREAVEGPQIEVRVPPFWMGEREIRWQEYKRFMYLYDDMKQFETLQIRQVTAENRANAVTAPTNLYEPTHTFEFGEDPQRPAIPMTQFAAKQYTKWLSLISGRQYRLPTEAEWEHAARAGTETAYFFGDDGSELGEYAWYSENADGPQFIGQKRPNPWGLYDIYGNAAEWVLDELLEDGYASLTSDSSPVPLWEAVSWPEEWWPRVVRGGHWGSTAEECRSAARLGSDYPAWKEYDPNYPKSPWWMTTDPARGVGFRLVRSLEPLDDEQIERFWELDNEDERFDVEARLEEGRGVLGLVDESLPAARAEIQP